VIGREGFNAGGQSAPSLLWFLLGSGGDTLVIYFGRGRDAAWAVPGFHAEEAAERERALRRQADW
jgi:hypothetical protein